MVMPEWFAISSILNISPVTTFHFE